MAYTINIGAIISYDEDTDLTLQAFDETKKKLAAGAYKVDSVPDMTEYSGKRFEYMLDKPKNK